MKTYITATLIKRCSNCAHYSFKLSECWRHPPAVFFTTQGGADSVRPYVNPEDRCGEFVAMVTPQTVATQ